MAADLHKKSNNDGILSAKAKAVRLFLFVAALALVVCMIFCLAACNDNDGGGGDVTGGESDVNGGSDVEDGTGNTPQDGGASKLLKFEGITLEDTTVVYDGETHVIQPLGDIPAGTTLSYSQKNCKDAGAYLMVVTLKHKGYETLELRATLTILPAPVEVEFANREFVWDGNPHSLYVVGALPKGSVVTYDGNDKIEPGEYVVTAHIEMDKNYEPIEDMQAILTIKEREYVISFIHWDDTVEERRVLRGGSLSDDEIPANKPKYGYKNMIWDPEWLAKVKNVQMDFYVLEIEGEAIEYTATLNLNGGVIEATNGWYTNGKFENGKFIIYFTADDNITLANPFMQNHRFEGWYDDETGKRVYTLPDGEPRDMSLTAHWNPPYTESDDLSGYASARLAPAAKICENSSLPFAFSGYAGLCPTRKKFAPLRALPVPRKSYLTK